MTDRDTIIKLAREAGFSNREESSAMYAQTEFDKDICVEEYAVGEMVARFAALIEQHLISQGYRQCAQGQRTTQYCGLLEDAVREEREACARVCDARYMGDNNREDMEARRCAANIRARGQQPQPDEDNPSF